MQGCQKHFLSYFVNSQIWLGLLMDECHLNYITKLMKTRGKKEEENLPSPKEWETLIFFFLSLKINLVL